MPNRSLKLSPVSQHLPDEIFHSWIFQNSWLGALIVDLSTEEIVNWNRTARDLFLQDQSGELPEIITSRISQFIPENGSLVPPHKMADGSYFECLFQRADGSFFPAQVQVRQLEHERRAYSLMMVMDISTQKRMQRDLEVKHEGLIDTLEVITRKNREMEDMSRKVLESQSNLVQSSKMAALGEMASGVAHEINNPLAIIRGTASLMRESLQNGAAPDVEKLLKSISRIEDTAKRIAKIITGLRSFSRNSVQDPMEPVLITQILEDSFALCSEKFKTQSIDLRSKVSGFENCKVRCRASQLSQVLVNLLNNAHDAIASLPEKWIEVSLSRKGHRLVLRVTDSGAGIPPEVLARLMQPFFTTKEVGRGTGLGLSISKGIVEDHQGTLTLDTSSPNTCFVIDLPLA